MLSEDAFEVWCQRLGFLEQTKALISQIRSSPPSRLVRSAAGNVSGRYPSRKMGCTIQFESHRGELAAIYQFEHDPTVLEFYDQPSAIKLVYPGKKGKHVGVLHTPDFFVLREESCGWIECKMEDHLVQLTERMPHRYVRTADGNWSCPPAEAYAQRFGVFYSIQSSAQIDWVYQRNLRFLEDYLRCSRPHVEMAMRDAIRACVMRKPGLTLLELLKEQQTGTADDIYFLIATDVLSVDLSDIPLADPEHVQVFVDHEQAQAYATLRQLSFHSCPRSSSCKLMAGTLLWWDGKPWRTLNLGETTVTLLSPEKQLLDVPIEAFDTLITQRKIIIATLSPDDEVHSAQEQERIAKASPKHLEIATQRYKLLAGALPQAEGAVVAPRTLQRWHAEFRTAEVVHGHGFSGLIPRWSNSGNRLPRFSQSTEQLLEKYIIEHYETLKQQSKRAVYLLLEREARENNIPVPSYRTFCIRVKQRPRYEQTLKRQGTRAAAQGEPWVWELEQTTARHGDRPWEIVHMDHTELDIELVSARTGRALGRPWATFMTDAFSRRLLVVYLTFDPPSYRSCMMTLRECVWRYGRFPQTLIVDGGPDFRSLYFEALLAYYSCTKATRPWAKPRYGSVCERLFGTANTQFVHNLTGNTQITKQVRQVTKAVDPKRHAVWTLGDLYAYLCQWAYDVYDMTLHPALDMAPREAFKMGIARSGARRHCLIDYNDTFRFFSLPTTAKGTAMIEPGRGVKINHLYYWSDEFRPSAIEHTQVPIRYDPFDIGVAFAFVQGHWVQCISEYYLQFKGHSERELLLATAELRQRLRNQSKEFSITGKRLAEFLASVEAHEGVLTQRLQDAEAQDVLALMGGYQAGLSKEDVYLPGGEIHQQVPSSEQDQSEKPADVYAGLEIYEEYQ
ncbi:MAG TPA: Mu transposase C-terminal domain-containing protein [Ktedonobacteraceae bacterium]|jgi:transposase InsO family protein|nr:Mu transposase C-terminal domain-containing protein [Ktedonobacteraceae bacterium]